MIISNDTKKDLRYAKDFTITSNYIILYRGSSVIIYDKQFTFLKKITGVKYVYKGYVSPDEKKLLLVSNENRIYLVSLKSLTVEYAYTVTAPYTGNLEGLACWKAENNAFFLPIQNSATMLSTIRKIHCTPNFVFEDFLAEKFWIVYISFVKCRDQYLAIGLNRDNQKWNVIWISQENDYTVKEISNFDEAILGVSLMQSTEHIILIGETRIHYCDFNGVSSEISKAIPFDVSTKFGFVTCVKVSKYSTKRVYMGTSKSFIIVDLSQQPTIRSFEIEFGVHNVDELQNDILLVSTWNGVKLLKNAENLYV